MREGNAIVYCEGGFSTHGGRTAHGLVRNSRRYKVLCIVDSELDGQDAGVVLNGYSAGIPIVGCLRAALEACDDMGDRATHFIIAVEPDDGLNQPEFRSAVFEAIAAGLHVENGSESLLTLHSEMVELAATRGVRLRDVRSPPAQRHLHRYTGKIAEVDSLKIGVLGTDLSVGKRTTAWLLIEALKTSGI